MASARAELKTVISADSSQFSNAMNKAGMLASQTANKIRSKFNSAALSMAKTGTAAAAAGAGIAAAGAAALAFKGAKLAASMESTAVAFETLLGSADSAKTVLAELKKLGAETPFEFPELADAGRKLIAFGESADTVSQTLRRVGDVAAGVQAPISEIAEIYGKARVQGRLFAEDINQLTGRGIPIIGELAKQFGVSESEVKKLVESGKVGFPELEKAFIALTSEGGKFYGMMQKQSETTLGLTSTLKDTFNEALTIFGQPINDAIRPLLKDAITVAAQLSPIAKQLGEDFAAMVKDLDIKSLDIPGEIYQFADGVKQVADWTYKLFQLFDKIGTLIGVMFASAFSPEVWKARFDFLKTGFRVVIEVLAKALGNLFSGDTFKKLIMGGLSGKSPFELLGDAVGDAFDNVDLDDSLKTAYAAATDANKAIGQDMKDKLADVFSPLKDIGDIVPKKDPTAKPAEVEVVGPPKPTEPESKEPSPETAGGLVFGNKVASGKAGGGTWKDRMKKAVAKVLDAKDKKEKTKEEEGGVALKESAEKIKAKEREDANLQAALQKMEEKQLAKRQAAAARAAMFANGGLAMSNSRLIGGGLSVDYASRGVASGLTTGGLGEKRRLATSKDQREAKKALTAQEAQLDKLSSIDSNIKQALTVA